MILPTCLFATIVNIVALSSTSEVPALMGIAWAIWSGGLILGGIIAVLRARHILTTVPSAPTP